MLRKIILIVISGTGLLLHAKEIRSIHPLFTEQTSVLDDRILGTWLGILGDSLVFSRSGDNFYRLELRQTNRILKFEVHLIRINPANDSQYYVNLYPADTDKEYNIDPTHVLPLYSFYKIDLKGNKLNAIALRYEWFQQRIVAGQKIPEYVWIPDGLLLTGSTENLRNFIIENDTVKAMYMEPFEFRRANAEEITGQIHKSGTHESGQTKKIDFTKYFPGCLPEFPNKDGWLGGDGAISVPLSDRKILWTFSDTFVGRKEQRVREGATMVSNTIAISTCDPDSGWDINYYWRDMDKDVPSAFFQTYTSRYRYWPQDAFRYKGAIYVALNKVATAYGPDSGLGFDNIGATLARITNYDQTSPEEWQIEYIPWSEVIEQHSWKGMVVNNDHLYLFTQFPEKKAFLRRVPLDHLDQPAEHMEYWSITGNWKQGLDTVDAQPVLEEPISGSGGSVRWHDDLNQWILIHGPGWYASEIYMHTAPALTGRWTRGKIIYEVPERIAGNPEYDKDKFCYFAREHAQYYTPATRMLVFTYDCNVDPFTRLIRQLDVYFPRVVRIPLRQYQ